MACMSTEDKIRHYQRSIDRSIDDRERLLHCIGVLSKLPVTVQHLQDTGIGRTVNALRKIEDGVGEAAKSLVAKWKYMVANTDTSEEEDEACVPDVPECYESPDCDSEPEAATAGNVGNRPEALSIAPPISSPIVFDEGDVTPPDSQSHAGSNGRMITSDDEYEQTETTNKDSTAATADDDDDDSDDNDIHEEERSTSHKSSSSKDKHASKSSKHSSKSSSKEKSSKKESDKSKSTHKKHKSDHKHKHKSSKVSKNDRDSENTDTKSKDKSKIKSESSQSTSSSISKEKKHREEEKKRKYDSSSSEEENNKKKKMKLSSDEEEDMEENDFVIDAGGSSSEDEQEDTEELEDNREEKKRLSSSHSKAKESSLKGESQSDKSKSKNEHRSSNSSLSKIKSSSDIVKKGERHSTSKSDEREKENKSKSNEHRSKESSKSKISHSSSSSNSKDKEKSRDKDKHSKDKAKESSNKIHKDEKEKSKSKDKEDKSKSKDEVKEHKKHKESKERKEHKEKKKVKKTTDGDGGIDCNSGTSFADALGMCTMLPPSSKKKKETTPLNLPKSIKTEKQNSSSSSTPTSSRTSTSKIKSEPPDSPESIPLLSSNVKLEPYSIRIEEEIDLSSTLPEPSLHYKPLPQINPAERRRNEDQMLSQVIYAKNQRTKVFSGNKTGYTSVPTLYELCLRVLIENIDALEFTGGVPYDIIKPVLERATPDQLFILEHHNPYLVEESDSLWQFHCNKDFRTKQREEMESWREMYMRCLDEREAKLKTLTANIKQSIDKSTPLRSTKLAYVDNVVKPPRNVLRKQAKYGTANTSSKSSDIKKKIIAAAAGPSSGSGGPSGERISVPPPPVSRARMSSSSTIKKVKAPLMVKALQAIKGRYKR